MVWGMRANAAASVLGVQRKIVASSPASDARSMHRFLGRGTHSTLVLARRSARGLRRSRCFRDASPTEHRVAVPFEEFLRWPIFEGCREPDRHAIEIVVHRSAMPLIGQLFTHAERR